MRSSAQTPISGGPEMVEAGTIGLFIGGDERDVERFLPVAGHLSNRVTAIGPLGAGAAAKIVNNIALAGAYTAALESIRVGHKLGLGLETMISFLASSPGTTPMFKDRVPKILGKEGGVGFSIDGAVKDVGVFLSAAREAGADTPALEAWAKDLIEAADAGLGELDVAAIVQFQLDGPGRG